LHWGYPNRTPRAGEKHCKGKPDGGAANNIKERRKVRLDRPETDEIPKKKKKKVQDGNKFRPLSSTTGKKSLKRTKRD